VQNKQGQVLLIGRARYGGIEVDGQPGLLNFTAFEAAAGRLCLECVLQRHLACDAMQQITSQVSCHTYTSF